MSYKIQNELHELVTQKVITPEIAQNITNYITNKENEAPSKIIIIFGILGAILGGLGIILLFAHNWDDFSIFTKSCISFLPLLIGQAATALSLLKKQNDKAWTEPSAVFLFFAVGASMALISQIYNIPGNFSVFVLTWMLLCLPLVYIVNSSVVSLLYIIGITVYCFEKNTSFYANSTSDYWFWLLILGIIPHYYNLLTQKKSSNFTSFHSWVVPIAIAVSLISIVQNTSEIQTFLLYTTLFSAYYLLGKLDFFNSEKLINNGYVIIGKISGLYLLYMASFRATWTEFINHDPASKQFVYILLIVAILSTFYLLYMVIKNKKTTLENGFQYTLIVSLVAYALGFAHVIIPVILINGYVLFIGIQEISKGNQLNNLARMNFGIIIITILIICRFMDTDMSFIIRGILFIIVGFGFFLLNYMLIKKRKKIALNTTQKTIENEN